MLRHLFTAFFAVCVSTALLIGCDSKSDDALIDPVDDSHDHSGHDHDAHDHGDHDHSDHDGHDHGDTSVAADEDYPLDICVVSEHALGSMGDPIVIQYEGKTVKFCCASCVDEFKKEPAKYMAVLAAASTDAPTTQPADMIDDAVDQVEDAAEDAADMVDEAVEDAGDAMDEAADDAAQAVDDAAEAVEEAADDAADAAAGMMDEGDDMIEVPAEAVEEAAPVIEQPAPDPIK